jgi:hypothetical protein
MPGRVKLKMLYLKLEESITPISGGANGQYEEKDDEEDSESP